MSTKDREIGARAESTVFWQRFAVPFEYPVHFTERVFDPHNPVLAETVSRLEPERRHRCLVFVDDGLLAARPKLGGEIEAYAQAHGGAIELVTAPVPVPGGASPEVVMFSFI